MLRLHPLRERLWLYYPPGQPAQFQMLRVCDRTGWDAATLSWSTCGPCDQGRIWKISISDHWQRQGLGRRMILRAMRGADGYHWTTTHQSPDGKRFFSALSRETGASFITQKADCEHINARGRTFGVKPKLERP